MRDISQAVALVIRPGKQKFGGVDVDLLLIDRSCHERPLGTNSVSSSESLIEAIMPTVEKCQESDIADVIMDLVNVPSIDSRGLGMLVLLFARARKHNGRLILANLGPRLVDIMAITRLDQVIRNVGSLQNAVEYYSSGVDGVGD